MSVEGMVPGETYYLVPEDVFRHIQRDFPGVGIRADSVLRYQPADKPATYNVGNARGDDTYANIVVEEGLAEEWRSTSEIAEAMRPMLNDPAERLADGIRNALENDERFERRKAGRIREFRRHTPATCICIPYEVGSGREHIDRDCPEHGHLYNTDGAVSNAEGTP